MESFSPRRLPVSFSCIQLSPRHNDSFSLSSNLSDTLSQSHSQIHSFSSNGYSLCGRLLTDTREQAQLDIFSAFDEAIRAIEHSFVSLLDSLLKCIIVPLSKSGLLSDEDFYTIFAPFFPLYDMEKYLTSQLEKVLPNQMVHPAESFATFYTRIQGYFAVYSQFVSSFPTVMTTLTKAQNTSKDLNKFMKVSFVNVMKHVDNTSVGSFEDVFELALIRLYPLSMLLRQQHLFGINYFNSTQVLDNANGFLDSLPFPTDQRVLSFALKDKDPTTAFDSLLANTLTALRMYSAARWSVSLRRQKRELILAPLQTRELLRVTPAIVFSSPLLDERFVCGVPGLALLFSDVVIVYRKNFPIANAPLQSLAFTSALSGFCLPTRLVISIPNQYVIKETDREKEAPLTFSLVSASECSEWSAILAARLGLQPPFTRSREFPSYPLEWGKNARELVEAHNGTPFMLTVLYRGVTVRPGAGSEQGVFRLSSGPQSDAALRRDIALGVADPFTAAGTAELAFAIKKFFAELKEPLLTHELEVEWMEIEQYSDDERLEKVKEVLEKLPPENYLLMEGFVRVLYETSQNSLMNMMSPKNLAIVTSSSFIWKKGTNLKASSTDLNEITFYNRLNNILATVIEFYPYLFPQRTLQGWSVGCIPFDYIKLDKRLVGHLKGIKCAFVYKEFYFALDEGCFLSVSKVRSSTHSLFGGSLLAFTQNCVPKAVIVTKGSVWIATINDLYLLHLRDLNIGKALDLGKSTTQNIVKLGIPSQCFCFDEMKSRLYIGGKNAITVLELSFDSKDDSGNEENKETQKVRKSSTNMNIEFSNYFSNFRYVKDYKIIASVEVRDSVTSLLQRDGKLWAANELGNINVYNEEFCIEKTIHAHKAKVNCMLNVEQNVWSCSDDGCICVISLRDDGLVINKQIAHRNYVTMLTQVGSQIWSCGSDMSIFIWNLKGKLLNTLSGVQNDSLTVLTVISGRVKRVSAEMVTTVLSASLDGSVCSWRCTLPLRPESTEHDETEFMVYSEIDALRNSLLSTPLAAAHAQKDPKALEYSDEVKFFETTKHHLELLKPLKKERKKSEPTKLETKAEIKTEVSKTDRKMDLSKIESSSRHSKRDLMDSKTSLETKKTPKEGRKHRDKEKEKEEKEKEKKASKSTK